MKGTSFLISATEIDFGFTGSSVILKSTSPAQEGVGPVYLGKEKGQIWWEETGRRETMDGMASFFLYISAVHRN